MVADRRNAFASLDMDEIVRQARDLKQPSHSHESSRQTAANPDDTMSAAKFFIPTLPGLPADSTLTMWAGHIPSAPPVAGVADTTSDAHLFFFLIRNRHIADTERTVIWFNGGPGCSSFDGSLMEIGPLRLVPGGNGELKQIEGAWNEYANILFIDQPVGTGYSYVSSDGYVHELAAASDHIIEFLSKFYDVFPEFSNHDTYLAGESYAGQYIPYFADAILSTTRLPTRLKGLLIGNGWMDPVSQYPAYLEFALDAGVVKKGSDVETRIRKDVKNCLAAITGQGAVLRIHNPGCEGILGAITDSTVQSVNGQSICVNNYDVRLTDTHPACGMNWPPDLADITPYLRRPEVKAAFHATRKNGGWTECNGNVGANFWVARSPPSVTLLPKLLTKVPILLFAGDQDLICNHVGIERMIEALTWNDETGFGNVTAEDWRVDGRQAGTWQTARGLTYVKIADASHMVPYDQPLAAHDMFLRFVGADLLGAAGPAAQVPSRVGDELEAVLGETHPNGTAVNGDTPELDDTLIPSDLYGNKSSVDALVNAASAVIIIFVLLVAFFTIWICRRKRNRRRAKVVASHSRRDSSGRAHHLPRREDEGPHELDELVRGGESSSDDRDEREEKKMLDSEEIFNVGSDDEDEDGRSRRKEEV